MANGRLRSGRAKISARPGLAIQIGRIRAGFEPRRADGISHEF